MKVLSRILVIAMLAQVLLVRMPLKAFAAGEENLLFMDISTVVGVSKKAENVKETPMSVYVVTNEEMSRWGIRSFYELFQRVPGYSFYNTDYYGQYGPIARGLQSIWREGVSIELMNIVDFGHMNFVPNWFKSVEIARGPSGLTMGSGAEAGLVNMNVRDDLNGTEVSVQGGNNGRQVEDLMYGKKFTDGKPGDGIFFGYRSEAQSYTTQQDMLGIPASNVQWKENGEYPSETLLAKIQTGPFKAIVYQDHADEIAPTIWFAGSNVQNQLEQFQGNLNDQMEVLAYRMEYHIADTDNFSFYLYSDDYKKQWWVESVALDTQRKRTAGINGDAKLADGKLDINFGGDLWGEDQTTAPSFTSIWAAARGIQWYDTATSPSEIQKTPFANFFVQGNYALSNGFKVLLGGRADYQKDAQPTNTIYTGPRIGLMYSPTDKVTFKYLYNGTARRPQGNEITAGAGAPSAETLAAHELIAIADISDKLKLDLTLFSQKLQNEISRVNGVGLNYFTNTGGLTTNGLEWAIKYLPMKDTLVYWNGSYDASQVNEAVINGVVSHDAENPDHDPLFVPVVTSFIGTEISPTEFFKVNVALRSILDIPYQAITGEYTEANAEFVDVTIRTKKFWKNTVDLSLVGLNVCNNQQPLPAYGEHSGNAAGTLQPEGVSVYLKATFDF
jgi:iron complex outermembrane receptor protein